MGHTRSPEVAAGPGRAVGAEAACMSSKNLSSGGGSAGRLPGSNPAEDTHLSHQSLCHRHGGRLGPDLSPLVHPCGAR